MNVRGNAGNYSMLFAFVFLWVVVALGLFAGVYAFFGEGYDFRRSEAEILNFKVSKCLVEHDFFEEGFNLTEDCHFNSNFEGRMIYVEEIGTGKEPFIIGQNSFIEECTFNAVEKNRGYPICVGVNLTVKEREFRVFTGSNKDGKREIANV